MSPDLTQATSRGDGAHRRRSPWRTVALVAGGFVVVAACGGGGGDSDATEAPAPTSAPTTGAPTTVATSAAPTTVATTIPATDPVVTDPVATEPPPTTLDPVALDAQIRADFERTWVAYYECIYSPETCRFAEVNKPGTEIDEAMRSTIEELLSENLRGLRDSGPLGYEIRSIDQRSDGLAVVTACATDGGVLVDIGDPGDPADDAIVNDAVNSYLVDWEFVEVGARWERTSVTRTALFAGSLSCNG